MRRDECEILLEALRRSSYISALPPADREDVLQATVELLLCKYAHLREPDLSRVGFKIAKLLSLAELRDKRRGTRPITQDAPAPGPGPVERLEHKEEEDSLARLRAALHERLQNALTPEQREAVFRRFNRNEKLREIADAMGLSVSGVH
jgi:DNA-directed RNA polymerase specialized sigma24 family protein